ncbi:DUF305 domain-containing protein [Pleomorphomonas diazotrophica]|uniref:DUF305 domain-containing protein n=1 Tax=Pleomorphomonas diazotrophica TaxID=1166257 RepID=A0A1I4V7L5_9HYPH|nr:DUF305 domain-containing protein [Pleomorphomonas diazotrophica]PKR87379.1 DUF305 domain-containing protein [Pleomorphomonas diazotrophica]SFM97192.1 protein of unknown function [Pleomorphomonas diazotrophica]
MHDHQSSGHDGMGRPYVLFAVNMVLSLVVMYFVMFSMIDGWRDFRNNLNMLYMALTMVAPMGIIMLATMGGMYANRKLNAALHLGLVLLFLAAFAATRTQAVIGDRQFIASMVPHHSGAILMCRQASLDDPELIALCADISAGQRAEIEQMNAIRARLDQGDRQAEAN